MPVQRWKSPNSSYEKRCLGTETLFLGGETEVSMGILLLRSNNLLVHIDPFLVNPTREIKVFDLE